MRRRLEHLLSSQQFEERLQGQYFAERENRYNPVDAIAFNQAGPAYRGVVQLTYRLDVNEFRGIESPQLIVEQIVNIA
jgi:hypothetical protein